MSLSFTTPSGFRFFLMLSMITVLFLCLSKSIVDQFKDISSILQFTLINVVGFLLFLASLLHGSRISNSKHQWLNNSFLSAGAVLVCYSSSVEIEEDIHSSYIPVFYVVELLIVLICGSNKMGVETTPKKYSELTAASHFQSGSSSI
jgi:hypothetical protein